MKSHAKPSSPRSKVLLKTFALGLLLAAGANAQNTYTYTVGSGTHSPDEYGLTIPLLVSASSAVVFNIADGGVLLFDSSMAPAGKNAIDVTETGTLQIGPSATGSTGSALIYGFKSNSDGGAINMLGLNKRTVLLLTNVTFRGNSTADSGLGMGGAINYVAPPPSPGASFINVNFEDNHAFRGGAMRIHGANTGAAGDVAGVFNMTGGSFVGNYALGAIGGNNSGEGGAITTTRTRVDTIFNNVLFSQNRARTNGGGVHVIQVNKFNFTDSIFTDNWAGGYGGAFYISTRLNSNMNIITSANSGVTMFTGNAASGTEIAKPQTINADMLVSLRSGVRPFEGAAWAGGFLYSEETLDSSNNYTSTVVIFNTGNNSTLVIGSPTAANRALDSIAAEASAAAVTSGTRIRGYQKAGAGTLILNADNSYAMGKWDVNAGKLLLGNSEAQLGSMLITVKANATFGGQGTVYSRYRDNNADVEITGTVLAQANAIIQAGNGKALEQLKITGDYAVGGDGVKYNFDLFAGNQSTQLALSKVALGAYTGTLNLGALASGTFSLASWSNLAGGDILAYFGGGANVAAAANRIANSTLSVQSGTTLQLALTMASSSSLAWTGSAGNIWQAGGAQNNWSGTTSLGAVSDFQNNDTVYFDGMADAAKPGNRAITIADAGVSIAGMTASGTADYKFEGGGITSSGALIKTGTATLSFNNGANTFTSIQLREGTLSAANANNIGGKLGSLDGSSFASAGDARLIFTNDVVFDGANQRITIASTGHAATIAAADGKTLTIQNTTGGGAIANAGQLTLGNVALKNNSGGALVNTGALTYSVTSGTITSSGNSVFLTQSTAGSAATIDVADGATLVVGSDADVTKDTLAITAGTLTKTGLGNWILHSDNQAFNGILNVTDGGFLLGGAGAKIGGTVNATGASSLAGGAGSYNKLAITGGTLLVGGGGMAGTSNGRHLSVSDLSLDNSTLRFGLYLDAPIANDSLNITTLSSLLGLNKIDVSEFIQGSYVIATGATADMQALSALEVTVNGENMDGPRQIIDLNAQSGALTLSISTGPSFDVTWTPIDSWTWNPSGTNWTKTSTTDKTTFASWDRVRFTGNTSGTVTLANTAYISDMHVSGTGNYTFAGDYGIMASENRQTDAAFAGTGKLYKNGAGTLSFQNTKANDFLGGIDWDGGTIIINNVNQIGTGSNSINMIGQGLLKLEGTGSSTLANKIAFTGPAARLEIQSNQNLELAGLISGHGNLVLGGTTALSGINTYSGTTTLKAGGDLSISRDANLGGATAALKLDGDATLRVTGSLATARTIDIGSRNLALTIADDAELVLEGQKAAQFIGTGAVALSGRVVAKTEGVLGETVNWNITSAGQLQLSASQKIGNLTNNGLVAFGGPAGNHGTLTVNNLVGSGTINMRVNLKTQTGDHLTILGTASGEHLVNLLHEGGTPPRPQDLDIPLISYTTPGSGARFKSYGLAIGLDFYELQDDPGNKTVRLVSNGINNIGDAVLVTAGVMSLDWHYSLDNVQKRMGEFRSDSQSSTGGNVWMRVNFYRLLGAPELIGNAMYQDSYDVNVGVDKGFTAGPFNLYAGLFIANSQNSRNFEDFGEGSNIGYGAGAYLTWLLGKGWFADLIVRYDKYDNKFSALSNITLTRAQYDSDACGASLEVGRHFELGRKFWVEPSAQVALVQFSGENYETDMGMAVEVESSRSAQYRLQLRAGADFQLWQPYLKFAIVGNDTKAGLVRVSDRYYSANFDGIRYEYGAGISWRVDDSTQVYLDYEYNKAEHYKRPWAFNIGYRYNW